MRLKPKVPNRILRPRKAHKKQFLNSNTKSCSRTKLLARTVAWLVHQPFSRVQSDATRIPPTNWVWGWCPAFQLHSSPNSNERKGGLNYLDYKTVDDNWIKAIGAGTEEGSAWKLKEGTERWVQQRFKAWMKPWKWCVRNVLRDP